MTSLEILNDALLPDNHCFGCGLHNSKGLHSKFYRDPNDDKALLGELETPEHLSGFHGITHGGVLYSAMDCLGCWVPTSLRPEKAIWILRSASVTYHQPALAGKPVKLRGKIVQEGEAWRAVEVKTEARNEAGNLLTEGLFKVIPLSAERFKQAIGIKELPENYQEFLGEGA